MAKCFVTGCTFKRNQVEWIELPNCQHHTLTPILKKEKEENVDTGITHLTKAQATLHRADADGLVW